MKKIIVDLRNKIEDSDWLSIGRLKEQAKNRDKKAQEELKKLGVKYK